VKEDLKYMAVDFLTKLAKELDELLVNMLNINFPKLHDLKRVLGNMKSYAKYEFFKDI
jgi:hypothetical protein